MSKLFWMAQGVLHHVEARSEHTKVAQVEQESGEEQTELQRRVVEQLKVLWVEVKNTGNEEYLNCKDHCVFVQQVELIFLSHSVLLFIFFDKRHIGASVNSAVQVHVLFGLY